MHLFTCWLPRILAFLSMGVIAPLATAQDDYPARPITLIVGYAAGGSTDSIARPLADALGRVLRAKLVIDNVAGAGGAIGAQKAVLARPDGYTLLLGGNGELIVTKLFNPRQGYDALKDLTPIGLVNHQGGVLLASRQTGVKTFEQFLQLVRKSPGKYNYATSGVGSMFHYAGEVMREGTHTQIAHVPYRGISTLGSDLAGGVVEFGFMGTGPARSFVEGGLVVPLAVTSGVRTPLYPNVPSLGEYPELKGYDLTGWFALMAPNGVPAPILAKLRAALKEALKDPQLRQILIGQGGLPVNDNEDLPKLMREDSARYQKFVAATQPDTQK